MFLYAEVQNFSTYFFFFMVIALSFVKQLQQSVTLYSESSWFMRKLWVREFRAKISLIFSGNTAREIQENIKQRFGAQVIRQHEKYLGLSSLVRQNKRNTFINLK